MEFKTVIQQRMCPPCQRGNHGACAYLVAFEEDNRGAVDAEDFIHTPRNCGCFNSAEEMHQDQRETLLVESDFVEDAMNRFFSDEPEPESFPLSSLNGHRESMGGGVLSDGKIVDALNEGRLKISPFRLNRLGPASYDVTLHAAIGQVYLPSIVDLRDIPEDYVDPMIIAQEGFEDTYYDLLPGEFILASTVETIGLDPCFAARVEGKSSLARLGLAVHVTGGFIDPGFEGQITLEMVNLSRSVLRIWPGIPIAQIAFMPVVGQVERPYGERGHYQHQNGPTGSRYRA